MWRKQLKHPNSHMANSKIIYNFDIPPTIQTNYSSEVLKILEVPGKFFSVLTAHLKQDILNLQIFN
jgi:hypothetical protein